MPYTSVNRQVSRSSRMMTNTMANMIYKVSRNVMKDEAVTEYLPHNDKYLGILNNFITTLTPKLQSVCETVDASMADTSNEDMEQKIQDTLGKVVTLNLGMVVGSDLVNTLQTADDVEFPPNKKLRA